MKSIIPIATSLLLIGTAAAFAGQPERPGAFGRDRADGVQSFQKGGENDTGAPGVPNGATRQQSAAAIMVN